MRRSLLALVAIGTMLAAGCTQQGGQSETEEAFRKLYREYSERFHEKMVTEAEDIQPVQITAEAARIWSDVFGDHKDIVRARQAELLQELDPAANFDEDLYREVLPSMNRTEEITEPEGLPLRQFIWSPQGAAQFYLNNWLARRMNRQSYQIRSVLSANAGLFWQVADADPDSPELIQRQGPMIFVVGLERIDDYYVARKLRWLRSKALGPVRVQSPIRPAPEPAEGVTPETGVLPGTGAVPETGTLPETGVLPEQPEGPEEAGGEVMPQG